MNNQTNPQIIINITSISGIIARNLKTNSADNAACHYSDAGIRLLGTVYPLSRAQCITGCNNIITGAIQHFYYCVTIVLWRDGGR